MILTFDRFSIDTEQFELRCNGDLRKVEPKVFDLIAYLALRPNHIFSREDLIEHVWQGRIVSDATVATCIKNARKALDDAGDNQNIIETVRNRGFRFSAEVSKSDRHANGDAPQIADSGEQDPSILILPFRCQSDEIEFRRATDSLVLDLSTVLTRVPLLKISGHSYPHENAELPPTPRQLHDKLGIDFVVEGTTQTTAGRQTANIGLSDARTGYRLWAETFDLTEPLAEAPGRRVATVIAKLEPQILLAMYRAVRASDGPPTARQLFLKAYGLLATEGWHHESFQEAISLLEQSIELDAELALSQALLSLLIGFGSRVGLSTDPNQARELVKATAEKALKLEAMDSTVLGYAGCSLADVGEKDRGESLLLNAIDINPANAQALVALGTLRIDQHDIEGAIDMLTKGIEISPIDSRLSIWGALLSVAYLHGGDNDAATKAARIACRRNDRTYMPRIALAAAYLANGNIEASSRAMAEAKRIKPDLILQQVSALAGDSAQQLMALVPNQSSR